MPREGVKEQEMRRKRNILKRNSGFVVGCVLAAGASFFTADILTADYGILTLRQTEEVTEQTERPQVPEEQETKRVYETDAFTVTASGLVIKGVEKETEKESEKEQETDETQEDQSESERGETEPGSSEELESESGEQPEEDADPDVTPTPDPEITPDPEPTPTPDPSPAPDPSPTPTPDPEPTPNPDPSPTPSPAPTPDPELTPNPDPSPAPTPTPDLEPAPTPDPGDSDGPIQIIDPGNGDSYYDDDEWYGGDEDAPGTPDDVILWGISSRYISESELYNYSEGQLRLIRNEIFALNGRMFKSQDLTDYFSQKSWYVPIYSPEEFDANMFDYLNDYEIANLEVILNYEAALGGY